MQLKNIFTWILRLVSAGILLQTLYFKFGGHPDSIDLFTKLGVEPYGRIGTGVMELIASILILVPKWTKFGAVMAAGLMVGAIGSHIFVIGIEHAGDGGTLFGLAITVLVSALILAWSEKNELIRLVKGFLG